VGGGAERGTPRSGASVTLRVSYLNSLNVRPRECERLGNRRHLEPPGRPTVRRDVSKPDGAGHGAKKNACRTISLYAIGAAPRQISASSPELAHCAGVLTQERTFSTRVEFFP